MAAWITYFDTLNVQQGIANVEVMKKFCLLVGTAHPTIHHQANLLRLNGSNNFTGHAGDGDYCEDKLLAISQCH